MNDRQSEALHDDRPAWEVVIAESIARDSASDEETAAALRSVLERARTSSPSGRKQPARPSPTPPQPAEEQRRDGADELKAQLVRLMMRAVDEGIPSWRHASMLDELLETANELHIDMSAVADGLVESLLARGGDLDSVTRAMHELITQCRSPLAAVLLRFVVETRPATAVYDVAVRAPALGVSEAAFKTRSDHWNYSR
ncbi:hypothetical protein ACIRJS_27495 [Streptomyces sp. NPDC102340]|uniref:hypothetical protein n=1 Tax=unclassified Streptomyces TaxID=2593676 RepID=UPI00382552FE